jgi:nucleotide-binding universal stress UspA family protein
MAANPIPASVSIPSIHKILVPVDFSETSTAAFSRALEVAKIYHASLYLVYVMAHPTASGMANILPGALLQMQEDLQLDLDAMAKHATDQGIPCTTVLREGGIVEHVRDLACHQGMDLLVLATHGGRGVHGVFLGSTAERLIRSIPVPVLTIGIAHQQPGWEEIGARHILFAGDFCPETLCGLSYALRIRQRTGAKLSVVRVVPPGTKPEKIRALRESIEAIVPPGTDIHLPEGKVGEMVCKTARKLGAGLIALGVHKNSFSREFFGTCLVEILLDSPCPVLSVRQCD